MSMPTSLRIPPDVRERLERVAARGGERSATLATRLIDEGLRMSEHPGVLFIDGPSAGRVATLARGPEIAEVMEVLTGLEATGEERILQTAAWLSLHPSEVRIALGYCSAFPEEIEQQRQFRLEVAAEERARYDAERALLG
jgi:hypothetical protein